MIIYTYIKAYHKHLTIPQLKNMDIKQLTSLLHPSDHEFFRLKFKSVLAESI